MKKIWKYKMVVGFENLNTRIISNSIKQYKSPAANLHERPESSLLVQGCNKIHNKESHNMAVHTSSILVGIIVGGIIATKGRRSIVKFFNRVADSIYGAVTPQKNPNVDPILGERIPEKPFDVLKRDRDVLESESLKERLADKFPKVNIIVDSAERQAERVKQLIQSEDTRMPLNDKRMFTSHEAEMVYSYLENDVYNNLLRLNKISSEKNIEVRTLNEIIDEALPLKEKTIVYRPVLTQNNDLASKFYAGNTIEEKGFSTTSRNAAYAVSQMGEESGYIMRVNLPQGTKGIDCRRFTLLDYDTGENATFILPQGAKYHINSVNDKFKIMDADYILQTH